MCKIVQLGFNKKDNLSLVTTEISLKEHYVTHTKHQTTDHIYVYSKNRCKRKAENEFQLIETKCLLVK